MRLHQYRNKCCDQHAIPESRVKSGKTFDYKVLPFFYIPDRLKNHEAADHEEDIDSGDSIAKLPSQQLGIVVDREMKEDNTNGRQASECVQFLVPLGNALR